MGEPEQVTYILSVREAETLAALARGEHEDYAEMMPDGGERLAALALSCERQFRKQVGRTVRTMGKWAAKA